MPINNDPTPSSGIDLDELGFFTIGVETFFTQRSPIGDFNQTIFEKDLEKSFQKVEIFQVSAALRPPEPKRSFWGKINPFKTDGLFRVHLDDIKILSIILKSSAEPQVHSAEGFSVQLPQPPKKIKVEFQQAGAGNSSDNPSNMELQVTGRFFT
ncbi:hypothetical protein MYX75_04980 [Acidobacteria bacterium AH-259-A15]|nr:hypothetical protein [Acidobacteria bacterium AH-259-A15]